MREIRTRLRVLGFATWERLTETVTAGKKVSWGPLPFPCSPLFLQELFNLVNKSDFYIWIDEKGYVFFQKEKPNSKSSVQIYIEDRLKTLTA